MSNRYLIVGDYDTSGVYAPKRNPIEVVQFGDTLRDPFDGMVWGVKDDYGDWVNPTLYRIGRKAKLEVKPKDGAP